MKFLAPAAYVTTAVTSAEGEACRVDNGSVRGHNRIARRRCRAQSIDNVLGLGHVGKLKLRGLKLSLKGLDFVLSNSINDPLCSGVLSLDHITETIVYRILKNVGLCCHIVVDITDSLFQITAILLSYRLFILYICRFPRQFGLYLHPINDRSRVLVSRLLVIRPHSLVSEPSRLLLSDFIWLGC